MRRSFGLVPVLATMCALVLPPSPVVAATQTRPDVVVNAPADPDHLIVRFKDSAQQSKINSQVSKHKLAHTDTLDRDGTVLLNVGTNETPATVAKDLVRSGTVELAEPDYTLKPTGITNDTLINNVWGLNNTGQTIQGQIGVSGVDVNASTAWSTATGTGVVVGVLDEGVDINHPELASHIWTNTADCFSDGVDHDGDGYVNDCHGWDFYHDDNSVFDAVDGDDHGTHVAGTIAASANNTSGVAGVAPNVTIMPLKFLGPGGGATSDAIRAISFAQAHGVKVINCSWGGSGFSQALKDAMANSPIVFAVASGNSGANIGTAPEYPAAFDLPNIVTVAAVDNRGALAGFSNYGGTTSVAAPGVDILSTIPKKPSTSVAVENSNGSNTWRTAFWGFGLEAVVGATARRDVLATELTRLGAAPTDPILVVDDDESSSGSVATPDTVAFYTAALTAAGFTNVTVTPVTKDASGPTAATMAGKYVIWETGYGLGSSGVYTLTPTDLSQLNTFVTSGGRLLLAGADAEWRNESQTFVTSTLGVTFEGEGDARTTATGVASTPFAGMNVNISGADSPFHVINEYQDNFAANGALARSVLALPADADYSAAYEYKSGTSMATPHVAAVAALCAQAAPTANAASLVTYVKAGVKSLSSLTGKVTTGGLVDAGTSVAMASGLAGAAAGVNPVITGSTAGYRFVASDGGIFTYGNAGFFGSAGSGALNKPVVSMASTPSGNGYWLVGSDGGIFAYGDAGFHGSTGAIKLNSPIVGMASTPTGLGYWLVASDGGIFAFGDAGFFGSTGAIKLNMPIVGMATTPSGKGYWLVASDGGIFAFGDAAFFGSTGAIKLNKPIVGMSTTPSGAGYWLVASDGGIFAFGDAGFFGSAGSLKLNKPIVGITSSADGAGYWLVASDGGIFSYGTAGFYGSAGNLSLNKPIVGMSR